ncbi:MAG TPA: aromatic ring-hydroxylating dioxygenase subunit alpha, partial [Alphaproteobacteria bacterium]|nr:aromatic ring-hydroxylating dioxygenase subunit alpha [Alphaproteobacteria bacterium]
MLTTMNNKLFAEFDKSDSVRHGLPGTVYTSGEFFELEANQLFAASWSFVGFAHQLANVGDVQP